VSDEHPNASTSTYSTLLRKVSSPGSCVVEWRQRYADRSHTKTGSPSTNTSVDQPSTTQKTCVEPWEKPCGTPSYVNRTLTTFRPIERRQFKSELSRILPAIDGIRQIVQSITNHTVSWAMRAYTYRLFCFIQVHTSYGWNITLSLKYYCLIEAKCVCQWLSTGYLSGVNLKGA